MYSDGKKLMLRQQSIGNKEWLLTGALYVHEVGVWRLDKTLEFVLLGLLFQRRVKEIDSERLKDKKMNGAQKSLANCSSP